jgi:hypothetical protein
MNDTTETKSPRDIQSILSTQQTLNEKFCIKSSFNLEHLKKLFRLITMHKQMKIVVFWVVTPCSLIDGYQRSGGTCHFCLMDHSVTTQTTTIDIFTTVRTSDLR